MNQLPGPTKVLACLFEEMYCRNYTGITSYVNALALEFQSKRQARCCSYNVKAFWEDLKPAFAPCPSPDPSHGFRGVL